MKTKLLEIRDEATFIPALALQVSGEDGYLWRRAGFARGAPMVVLIHLTDMRCAWDPYDWAGSRTMTAAHRWLEKHWDEAGEGDVLDVQYILGETAAPKQSEEVEHPLHPLGY